MSATVRHKSTFAEIKPQNTREFPVVIDTEVVMNAVAGLDDAVRHVAEIRRSLVLGVAKYERKAR